MTTLNRIDASESRAQHDFCCKPLAERYVIGYLFLATFVFDFPSGFRLLVLFHRHKCLEGIERTRYEVSVIGIVHNCLDYYFG